VLSEPGRRAGDAHGLIEGEMTRNALQFIRSGRRVRIEQFAPRATLLDWLRLEERSTGTKEGCAEGDCGACAVVVARERDGRLVHESVNSCITLLGQIDGAELITVEDLAEDGALHPVQEAMARLHGSQCGFCTPGIVMSLFAHYQSCGGHTSRDTINDVLAGNLCRCTGYRPIVDSARQV
jgi:xanthine dehydrogenase small subunit